VDWFPKSRALGGAKSMSEQWKQFAFLGVGVLVALIAPVNTVIAGFMTPLLSAITSSKGSYV
jgi:hypothetical protein